MAVLAMLLAEPKASQSLPALQAPDSVRCSRRPRGGGPEVPFVVLCLQPCQRWPLGAPWSAPGTTEQPAGTRCRAPFPPPL